MKEPAQRTKVNWDQLHLDYLQGLSVLELSNKYSLSFAYLKNRISEKGWLKEKVDLVSTIEDKTKKEIIKSQVNNTQKHLEQIAKLTSKALNRLEDILNDDMISTKDTLTAIGKVLDISGLKVVNQNTNNQSTERKIFITVDEIKKADSHIDKIIDAEIIK